MKTIYKYTLTRPENTYGMVDVQMPAESEVMSAIVQNGQIVVYALVEKDLIGAPITRRFYIAGTGQSAPDEVMDSFFFMNSVQQGSFVWHIFLQPIAGKTVS